MKQIRRYGGSRNDYYSDFICEYCGHQSKKVACYADVNFDTNVIPNALCPTCKKSSSGETLTEQEQRLGRTYQHWKGRIEIQGERE